MCQLTFVDFGNDKLNRLGVWQQWIVNTQTSNKDGFGLFNGIEIRKSEHDAQFITNFGTWIPGAVNHRPVIAHVRLATAVNGKKTIAKDSSHPFEDEKFVIAHNGVLEFRAKENYDKHKDITVDTQLFLNELSSAYNGTNFVEAIQRTMELFYGTFAFMIYSKIERKYFIVRGFTKKLHYSPVSFTRTTGEKAGEQKTGLIVNTDKTDLIIGLRRFSAIVEITGSVSVSAPDPIELKAETIYEVLEDKTLKEIGEIKEVGKPAANFTQPNTGNNTNYGKTSSQTITTPGTATKGEIAKRLAKFLAQYHLSVEEFDWMVHNIVGKPFFACNSNEILSSLVVCEEVCGRNHTKVKEALWDRILDFCYDPTIVYSWFQYLKFPYMLNSQDQLKRAIREIEKENENGKQ